MKKMYLFCAMMLLTACGTTRPSTFYVLDGGVSPERSVTIKDARGILIGIEPVFVPDYLNKPQIVIRQPDGVTLTASEYNRWAEQVSDVFPRVLGDAVSARMGFPAAKQINLNRDLFPYRLYVEIIRFDAAFGEQAVLDAWWTVMTGKGDILRRTRTTVTERAGNDYAAIVAAERTLIDRLGAEIADYASKHLKKSVK